MRALAIDARAAITIKINESTVTHMSTIATLCARELDSASEYQSYDSIWLLSA